MKRWIYALVIVFLLFFTAGCSLTDITENANDILTKSEELLTEIDNQVETGKLTQDVADKLKEVINSTVSTVSDEIQDNSGFIFNNVNQTLDNTFYNLGNLLVILKTEVLGGSAVDIMERTMSQIRLTTSQVSSELQDVIVLVSGQAVVFVDTLTNSIILITSIVLLAIGLLIFVIIFMKKKDGFKAGSFVALILTGIYVAFFLCVILIAPLRGWIICGLNIGQKVTARVVEPQITGIYPDKFHPGIDDRIYIYGKHLNLIKDLSVKLQQGSDVKKVFPANKVIIQNHGQIILGNLDNSSTGFPYLPFLNFKTEVIEKNLLLSTSTQIESIINAQKNKTFEMNKNLTIRSLPSTLSQPLSTPVRIRSLPIIPIKPPEFSILRPNPIDLSILQSTTAIRLFQDTKKFYGKFWNISEGLYGLYVYDKAKYIPESAPLEIDFPDPPAPKPDIFPVALSWCGEPLIGKKIVPRLVLGFTDYKEIQHDFKVHLRAIDPPGYDQNLLIKKADVASIPSNGVLTLYMPAYSIEQTGDHQFEVFVDANNDIVEKDETNNRGEFSVTAKKYKYDITVALQQFVAKKNFDYGDDEYRTSVSIFYNSGDEARTSINHDGNAGDSWSINFSKSYENVSPGDAILVSTSGYEEDNGNWTDPDDNMGSDSDYLTIPDTGTSATKNIPFVLEADGYKILGTYTITRSVAP